MKRIILATLVAVPLAAVLYWVIACPCNRFPGVYLRGTQVSAPITDWTFANKVPLCQIQVDAGLLPHALNLNCWANSQGELFLSCAGCEGKRWSTAALENPDARLRLGTTVYPVTLTRITDEAELDRAWEGRMAKTNETGNQPRSKGWWSFHVTSRQP